MAELSPEEQDLIETYGPAAPFSEHKRGQRITYQMDGFRYQGEILWVCMASEQGGVMLPLRYIVAPDAEGRFIDVVFPADVLQAE
jgi:hypothetical protein